MQRSDEMDGMTVLSKSVVWLNKPEKETGGDASSRREANKAMRTQSC